MCIYMTINNKNISNKAAVLLKSLYESSQLCFKLSTAYDILSGSSRTSVKKLLGDMVKRGLLMRIKDGLYYIIPYEQDSKAFMPDWHLLAGYIVGERNFYIGYYSALQLHGLTTQALLREQIVVDKQIKPPVLKIKEIPFQFIYHNKKHFFGREKIWIDSYNKQYCSDLEKTIIDCLFKPDYAGGITEISKAIYKAKDIIDFKKLHNYCIRFNSQAVIKRLGFLLELLNIDTEIIADLQSIRTDSFVLLEPSYPKEGKTIFRWAVQQNIDTDSIILPIYS